MALKDWKKKTGENTWIKKNDSVELITNLNKLGHITGYEVDIYIFDSRHIIKQFKTKSKALRFAKSYMRKH